MSDIFNHSFDADESMGQEYAPNFISDPLYYHEQIHFTTFNEISKEYLIDNHWVPKKICRQLDLENKTVWVHSKIYAKILEKAPVPAPSDEAPF